MLINDGYTRTFKLSCGVVGELRPMLRAERQWLRDMAEVYPDEQMQELIVRTIESHIVHWSYGRPFEVPRFHTTQRPEAWDELVQAAANIRNAAEEERDAANLYYGVQIKARYPHLTPDTCKHCLKYFYDPIDDETETDDANGKPYPRPPEATPICRVEGCPNGTPERPLSLSEKNRKALAFHLECSAVGCWPDDSIVRRNARLIEAAISKVRAARRVNARNRS